MGKRFRKSFTFDGKRYFVDGKTQKEADEKAIEKRTELENHVRKVTEPKSISQWMDGWIDTYKSHVSLKNQKQQQHILECFRDFTGDERMDRIKQRDIQRFINHYRGFCTITLQKYKSTLYNFFDTAEYNGIVTLNPVHNIQIPKRNSGKSRRSLTEEERTELLKVAEYHPMGLYVKVMLYCGLRTMEVAALDGRHIDRMNRLIHVRQNVGADGAIKGPKTDSGIRDVPIPGPLMNALSDVKLEPYQPVFVNANGKRVDRNWIQTRWTTFKQCMLSDGCTSAYDLVPYDLRHTYCTDLQTAGVPINIAKELMGHSSISVTANIYTHTSAQSMEEAAGRINALCQNRDIGRKIVGK